MGRLAFVQGLLECSCCFKPPPNKESSRQPARVEPRDCRTKRNPDPGSIDGSPGSQILDGAAPQHRGVVLFEARVSL